MKTQIIMQMKILVKAVLQLRFKKNDQQKDSLSIKKIVVNMEMLHFQEKLVNKILILPKTWMNQLFLLLRNKKFMQKKQLKKQSYKSKPLKL